MQNCPQQRKGFVESEVIDFPPVLDISISCDPYSQKTAAQQTWLVF